MSFSFSFNADAALVTALVEYDIVDRQDVLDALSWSHISYDDTSNKRTVHATSQCILWTDSNMERKGGAPNITWGDFLALAHSVPDLSWDLGGVSCEPVLCTECWYELTWYADAWGQKFSSPKYDQLRLPAHSQHLVRAFVQSRGDEFALRAVFSALAWVTVADKFFAGDPSAAAADTVLRRWLVDLEKFHQFVSPQAKSVLDRISELVKHRVSLFPDTSIKNPEGPLMWANFNPSWTVSYRGSQLSSFAFPFEVIARAGDRVFCVTDSEGEPVWFMQIPVVDECKLPGLFTVATTQQVTLEAFSTAVKLCAWQSARFDEVLRASVATFV